jgi:hypothetical protein
MKIPVEVITRNIVDLDEPPRRRLIDHTEDSDRRWLGKHAYWAMRNGYAVNTAPLTDAEYEDRKDDPAYARPLRG